MNGLLYSSIEVIPLISMLKEFYFLTVSGINDIYVFLVLSWTCVIIHMSSISNED